MAFIQTDSSFADAEKTARQGLINKLQDTHVTIDSRPLEEEHFGLQTDSGLLSPPGAVLSIGRKENLKMLLQGMMNKSGASSEDLIEILEEMD